MAGLLYKDFVALKGKIYVGGILAVLVLVMAVRLFLPRVYVDELLWASSVIIIFIFYFMIVERLEVSLIAVDEGRKQKQYYLSLPISKKQYVASKYLFLLLAFLVLLSFSILLQNICLINCENKTFLEMIPVFESMMPSLTCAFLLIPAIELPFFIGMGTNLGNQFKTGLLVTVFFLVIVYLLFGDLTLFDRINFMGILYYLKNHTGLLLCLQVGFPYIIGALYYLSYRISCKLFLRRGWEND